MKASRRTFIKQSALATIAAFGAGPLLWANSGCAMAQENAQVLEAMKNQGTEVVTIEEANQVPYLSTYYVEPRVPMGKAAVINYYVTDYRQKEFYDIASSDTFTVDYWVNGVKSTLPNIKAGDNSFNLKPMPKGEVLFALQVTDAKGRKSHRIFQRFLVVDPADSVIAKDKILTPDLKKFKIYNDDTHPVETTKGLTEMLQWASDNGYRKVLLPKGRYRLDEKSTVQMATKLTLDMNGSTFKLNPNALGKLMMFEMVNCFDSHVVNGTFEGDLKEHDFKTAPNYSEWVNAVNMGIDTQYSSFENIKVVDVTGYGTNTVIGGNGRGDYATVVLDAGTFTPGDINEKGETVPSEVRTSTEKPVDISAFLKAHGYFQLGLYLGYQSNPVDNWVYKASFYDADQKFIENIEGYVYRQMYPPKNAQFVRFTLLSKMTPGGLALFDFRPPYNCAFINVHHENIRAVGMCPSGFNNLLVEGNTFENCGWELARCAFDSEDGWDLMQDLTFRNNVFGKNPANEFLTAAGHNFVMENNTMAAYMWDRTNSAVYRNNKLKSASFLVGNPVRSGYHRISHNTIAGGVSLGSAVEKPLRAYVIRDNVISGTAQSDPTVNGAHFYKNKIEDSILVGTAVECELKGIKSFYGGFNILKSSLEDSTFQISAGTSYIADSTIKNVVISGSGGPAAVFTNNTIIESSFVSGQDWLPTHAWTFIDNKIQTSLPQLVQIGNSFKQVTLKGNTIDSTNPNFSAVVLSNPAKDNLKELTVTVEGNTFNAKGGTVLNIAGLPDAACTLTVYLFGNTYNGIDEISKIAIDAPNVKIVRAEPPQAKLAA